MEIELAKLHISKDKFNLAPETERTFFVLAANVLTELTILQKCTIHSINAANDWPSDDKLFQSAQNTQTIFFLRILSGILKEGWELIQTQFNPNKLSQIYDIPDLDYIKKYFGRKNIVAEIRKQFGFHFDANLIIQELNDLSGYNEFDLYISEVVGNAHYMLTDHIKTTAMAKLAGKEDLKVALDAALSEITDLTSRFQNFFSHYLTLFHEKYLNHSEKYDMVKINVPKFSEIKLPYFAHRDT